MSVRRSRTHVRRLRSLARECVLAGGLVGVVLSTCACCCANTMGDAYNCGECGHRCGEREICDQGVCRCPDRAGYEVVDGECVNILTDGRYCGHDHVACGGDTPYCVEGRCTRCDYERVSCDGECVDPDLDHRNCGRCGNLCPDDGLCLQGACVPPTGTGCSPPCDVDGGLLCCATEAGDECFRVGKDDSHCVACGARCSSECEDGECLEF